MDNLWVFDLRPHSDWQNGVDNPVDNLWVKVWTNWG